ncbi:MAG: glucuronosyltransferase [Sphingomonadaceae bacterium]|uniref:glycosyltransferase n=1 Tax=Thermaurantiacus sp. TaxID=2820283 RepID=UPI00298EE90F|nr:glycosyltransferase [Thermaurantiacus sp.]MCS6987018.1 glucuronosyltransferase [Sphingomonadaceae bacterium]MDW8415644.1 glycosyltransferase [Thermaurantiacus sp.]
MTDVFLTVGTQEPFDRLVRAVDAWAAGRSVRVFGQLGALGPRNYRPRHFPFATFLARADYARHLAACRLMVAHAGMGSIISALEGAKPILVLPRQAALGEHRNEHQLATARRFADRPGIHVVWHEDEVADRLDWLIQCEDGGKGQAPTTSPELIATLRDFIFAGR